MNLQEIKSELLKLTEGDKVIKLPFHIVQSTIELIKEKSDLELNVIDYPTIYFYKVTLSVQALLSHLNLTLDFELDEDDNAKNPMEVFEMYEEIYDSQVYKSLYLLEELLDKEISLAERKHIQLGMLESQLVRLMERATTQLENINGLIQDEKKVGKLLKQFSKNLPQVNELIKQK